MSDLSLEWDKFKRDYNKQYATAAEEIERKQIFIKNVNQIRSYQQTHPDATFTIGINHLADQRIEVILGCKFKSIEDESYYRILYPDQNVILNLVQNYSKVPLKYRTYLNQLIGAREV
jgi:hypothetical protein